LRDEDMVLAGADDRMLVRQLLSTLPERERTIVELRFYAGLSQSEIAERVGVSQVHVSRLLRTSLAELQRAAGDQNAS
jgi:RNA polymerase sigma-B factor